MNTLFSQVVAEAHDLAAVRDAIHAAVAPLTEEYKEAVSAILATADADPADVGMTLPALFEATNSRARDLAAVSTLLDLQKTLAMQVVRQQVLSRDGKPPTVAVVEGAAETDAAVMAWATLAAQIGLLRDQFAGVARSAEMLHQQVRASISAKAAG